ncbi:hypothetical protein EBU91_03225 [bacterium]|nr:hypothetical protein [bacterium]
MEKFSKFFNASKERFTPNTKTHHQIPIRSTNRKSQNQVARYYGYAGRKDDPIIDTIVKNKKKGTWNISIPSAQRILKTYGIKHTPDKSYTKSINRTGITINYDSNRNLFTLRK